MTDRKELKQNAREAMRQTRPSPVLVTLAVVVILLVTQALSLSLSGELDAYLAMAESAVNGELILVQAAGAEGLLPWLLTLALDLMTMVISAGYTLYAMRAYRRKNPGFGDVFDAFSLFFRVIILAIMRSLIVSAASFIYAVPAAALGGGLADLLVYPETIIYTIIIKALNAVFFSSKGDKILTKRNALMTIPSGLVTVVGYSLSKLIRQLIAGDSLHSAIVTALWKMPENAIQAVFAAIIFFVIALAFDKADIKHRMLRDL